MSHLLCLTCGNTTSTDEAPNACPACGDGEHPPADLADSVTVTLTTHELRILTIWAENWARQCGGDAMKAMGTILLRLGTQTDAALTLSQEIADVRAAFPDSEVTVHQADGTETDL
jgi:hypothetical protein